MYDAAIFGTKRAVRNWKVEGSPFKERFDLSKQFLPSKFPDLKVSDKTAMLLTYNCLLSILVTFSNYRLSIHLAVDYNRKTSIIFLPEQMRRVFMNKSDIHLVVFPE